MTTTVPNPPTEQAPPSQSSPGYFDIPSSSAPGWVQMLKGIFQPIPVLNGIHHNPQYGELYRSANPGFPPMLMLNSARAVEAVLGADPQLFDVATSNAIMQPLLGVESLLQLDGIKHRHRRKLIMPPFHGHSIQAYGQVITDVTQQIMAQWQPHTVFPAHAAMQDITLRVILKAVFGLTEGQRYEQLHRLLCDTFNAFDAPFLSACLFLKPLQRDLGAWSPWGQFLRRKQRIDQLLFAQIAERRQQGPGDDVLSLLLAAKDEQGKGLSDPELRDELMTLLFAGHETTATALTWAIYWIHRQPEVRDRILQELADLGPNPDRMQIAKLPYLSAVCNETLRIYPVVLFTFGRTTKQPFELLDHTIEPGIMLTPCIYLLHRQPELYPDAETFRPERFLERSFSPYEFIPFGGSNRRCIGYAFALFEMKVVLSQMLTQMTITLASQKPAVPERRGFTFVPSGGIPITAQPKS